MKRVEIAQTVAAQPLRQLHYSTQFIKIKMVSAQSLLIVSRLPEFLRDEVCCSVDIPFPPEKGDNSQNLPQGAIVETTNKKRKNSDSGAHSRVATLIQPSFQKKEKQKYLSPLVWSEPYGKGLGNSGMWRNLDSLSLSLSVYCKPIPTSLFNPPPWW